MGRRYLQTIHAVALLAALLLPVPWLVAAVLVVLASGWYLLGQRVAHSDTVRALYWGQGGWQLEYASGERCPVELGNAQISRYFIYMSFRLDGGRRLGMPLFADQLGADEFRRLTVALRFAWPSTLIHQQRDL